MINRDHLNPPVLLSRIHNSQDFDCGVPVLNVYLKQYALQNQKKNAARTFAATRGDRVVGYYTLAYGSVNYEEVSVHISKGLARHPVPVMLLARLAVDMSEQGTGVGKGLLKDALLRTMQASDIAGLRAVLVHAKDDNAKRFYERFGFQQSPIDAYQLMLRIDDIKLSISD